MNILIINWRGINHPWAGGAERHIHELSKKLIRNGHNVTLVCGGYKGASHKETIEGIETIRIGNTYTVYLLAPVYYLSRLRQRNFDLVIDTSHGISFFTPFFTRRKKILIIHHNHKDLWKTEWGGQIARAGIFLENKVMPFLYRNVFVITLSRSSKFNLEKLGYQKVAAIAPGISFPDHKYIAGKTREPTVLYLGRLRKYKRVDFLLKIFPEIVRKVKGAKLIIAGTGQDMSRIEHLIRVRKLKNVELKGYVSEEEKYNLLSSSWVLSFPSKIEGWGLVALEAASCGTPTVGFRVPGLSDSVVHGKTGYLAGSGKEYTDTIVMLLKNSHVRKSLGKGAREYAAKFTWEKCAKSFEGIIKDYAKDSSTS